MQHRQLAGAFDCFAGAVETMTSRRKQVTKIFARWCSSGLRKSVDRWLEYMEMRAQEHAREVQERVHLQLHQAADLMQTQLLDQQVKAQREAARRAELCHRAVTRVFRQHLWHAWHGFMAAIYASRRFGAAVRLLMIRQGRRVLESWRWFTQTRQRARALCARVAGSEEVHVSIWIHKCACVIHISTFAHKHTLSLLRTCTHARTLERAPQTHPRAHTYTQVRRMAGALRMWIQWHDRLRMMAAHATLARKTGSRCVCTCVCVCVHVLRGA